MNGRPVRELKLGHADVDGDRVGPRSCARRRRTPRERGVVTREGQDAIGGAGRCVGHGLCRNADERRDEDRGGRLRRGRRLAGAAREFHEMSRQVVRRARDGHDFLHRPGVEIPLEPTAGRHRDHQGEVAVVRRVLARRQYLVVGQLLVDAVGKVPIALDPIKGEVQRQVGVLAERAAHLDHAVRVGRLDVLDAGRRLFGRRRCAARGRFAARLGRRSGRGGGFRARRRTSRLRVGGRTVGRRSRLFALHAGAVREGDPLGREHVDADIHGADLVLGVADLVDEVVNTGVDIDSVSLHVVLLCPHHELEVLSGSLVNGDFDCVGLGA